VRSALGVVVAAVVLAASACGDEPARSTALTQDQALDALSDIGVTIPYGYLLVGMKHTESTAVGTSYAGAFRSATLSTDPIRLDGQPADLSPASCPAVGSVLVTIWTRYGMDCAMTDMRFVTARLKKHDVEIDLLTGVLRSGESRIFVYTLGD
jgi:hypothetical protein